MVNLVPSTIILLIWGITSASIVLPLLHLNKVSLLGQFIAMGLLAPVFILVFVTIAGTISRFGVAGIKKGKFPRLPLHPVYLKRRIYGLSWTQIYYFKPLYSVVLSIPLLKKYVLRLFGYKGSTNFTLYPDTWIRDLPLLDIGEGAYLSNRSTIGTNICLADDTIYVCRIKVGKKSIVGHLAMLAPGVSIGDNSEVGVGCAIGLHVRIGHNVSIKPSCSINHGAILRDGSDIGAMSYIGLRAEIGAGIAIPSGAIIPAGAVISTQEDVQNYIHSENSKKKEPKPLLTLSKESQILTHEY